MVKKFLSLKTPSSNNDREHIRAMSDKEIEAFHRKTYEKFIRNLDRERKPFRRK